MENRDLGNEIVNQLNDVLSRLESKELFQSGWDIATFVIFLTFIGTVILLIVLVLLSCCCGCCCPSKKLTVLCESVAFNAIKVYVKLRLECY